MVLYDNVDREARIQPWGQRFPEFAWERSSCDTTLGGLEWCLIFWESRTNAKDGAQFNRQESGRTREAQIPCTLFSPCPPKKSYENGTIRRIDGLESP